MEAEERAGVRSPKEESTPRVPNHGQTIWIPKGGQPVENKQWILIAEEDNAKKNSFLGTKPRSY